MKIFIVGDWHSELHEEAVFKAFEKLGHETLRFAWYKYFKPVSSSNRLSLAVLKAQNKYMLGPVVNRLNKDLVAAVKHTRPDILFVYRGSHIYSKTLKAIHSQSPNTILIGYNNDDPFSTHYPKWIWRHFIACLPEYHLVLAYRLKNLDELRSAGAKRVELLRSWYMPDRNYPVQLTEEEKKIYGCDVVFVGHYEDDGRVNYLKTIVRAGYKLRIWGPGYDWDPVINNIDELKDQVPVKLVWGKEYNKALCGAKIALCFFSQMNRDTYTRRCFEIPACGVFMLSAYSEDLASLFEEGKEIELFRSTDEMITKIERYTTYADRRDQVASAGRNKVFSAGHDVVSRMSAVLKMINKN